MVRVSRFTAICAGVETVTIASTPSFTRPVACELEVVAPAIVDVQVAILGPPQLLQPLFQRLSADLCFPVTLRVEHERTDAPYPRVLLCTRNERPRDRCTAEKRHELPSPHSNSLLSLKPIISMFKTIARRGFPVRGYTNQDCRQTWMSVCWHIATLASTSRRGPVIHSSTSSARASSVGGTSMPSDFAVLRLITNSNLVGCMTGRSPGLAPLRIRA